MIMLPEIFSIRLDYAHVFSGRGNELHDPLAIGVGFFTGSHMFHINFTNSTGIIPNTYLPYTTGSWLKGEIRFGFSTTRWFYL